MAATVSLSKGVFAFKKANPKLANHKQNEFDESSFWRLESGRDQPEYRRLTFAHYQKEWSLTNTIIENLLHDTHCKVLKDLVQYINRVGNCSDLFKLHDVNESEFVSTTSKDIPAACLVTGVNMPDHDSLFDILAKSLKDQVSPYVARLSSSACPSVKNAVFKIVNSFINGDTEEDHLIDSDDDLEIDSCKKSPSKRKGLKKYQYNMTVLNAWYKENISSSYESPKKKQKTSSDLKSPKKQTSSIALEMKPLIIIVEDVEGMTTNVLQDLILICSEYRQKGLPFVFVLGVATTPAAIHRYLSQDASTSVAIETFQSQPSSALLSQVVEKVLMSSKSFKVGGKIFKLLLDIFLFHDLSVNNFIQGIKYCMLEHYLRSNVSFLCCKKKKRRNIVANLKNDSLSDLKDLPSCAKYIASLQESRQKVLMEDDDQFKDLVLSELTNLEEWFENFCILVRVLHKLVYQLPGTPLGRQLREVLSMCLSQQVTESSEFQESWKMLTFSGKEELQTKLTEVLEILTEFANGSDIIQDLTVKLTKQLNDLKNVHLVTKDKETFESSPLKAISLKPSDRFHLREKLLGSVKPKTLSAFEELRCEILSTFEHNFIVHLKPPNSRPFHEVFFFDSIGTVKYQLLGSIRATITTGLSNPHKYLQCSCCKLEDSSTLSTKLPDLTLCYKLHLECGRMINLYDWMQAFVAVVQGGADEEAARDQRVVKKKGKIVKKKKNIDEKLQGRFVQAVSELQLLGFIKPTKRKTDHVQRLTWGGC